MRRICTLILGVVALAVPAGALGERSTDGSLTVSGASGSITLVGKGVVFGHVSHGTITVYSYRADGNAVPQVSGAKMTLSGNASSVNYSGNDVRFLLPGGRYKLEIDGTGIDLSAVGNGNVAALGVGTVTTDANPIALGSVETDASWGLNGNGNVGGNGNGKGNGR